MSERGLQQRGNGSRSAAAGHPHRASASARAFDEACAVVASRLRARIPEMEAGLADLIDAIPDPHDSADPTYLLSLRRDVRPAILEYAIDVIELGERRAPGIPPILLSAARLAARSGIALDILLRRYSAGMAMFGDVLVEEAEHAEVSPSTLRRLLRRQATLSGRFLKAVSE